EPQETRQDQLEQVHPLGVGEVDPATTAPASDLRRAYPEQLSQASLRAQVMAQRGDLLCGRDRHLEISLAQQYLLRDCPRYRGSNLRHSVSVRSSIAVLGVLAVVGLLAYGLLS